MSITRLLQSAGDVQTALAEIESTIQSSRNRLLDVMGFKDEAEVASLYERATADLNRITRRDRVLRNRVRFDREVQ